MLIQYRITFSFVTRRVWSRKDLLKLLKVKGLIRGSVQIEEYKCELPEDKCPISSE